MPQDIPPVDPDLPEGPSSRDAELEKLELKLLEAGAKEKDLANRETSQRIIFRWIATAMGIIVVVSTGIGMWHVVHMVFWGPFVFASPAFSVAIIVAPILCITTITVTFFVGAFGRFKDKDLEAARSSVGLVSNQFGGG